MKSARVHREDEDEEDEELLSRKDAPSSINREGKNVDKANAIRSKHSVTEQRRRSKINERFQLLRDLIPHSDQKRDTASFLLEVIDYVQYLQEKVQKYEGSYEGWSSEPTKLMPWRNTHWRVQNFAGHTQAIKNGSGPGSTYPGRLEESSIPFTPAMHLDPQNALQYDPNRDPSGTVDQQPELVVPASSRSRLPASIQGDHPITHPLQAPISDAQSSGCPVMTDPLSQHEDFTIEGGTISITNVYSQGLLNNLTQALQSSGVDLSQATISVQIDLGKRAAIRGLTSGASTAKDPDSLSRQPVSRSSNNETSNVEDLDRAQKKLKL